MLSTVSKWNFHLSFLKIGKNLEKSRLSIAVFGVRTNFKLCSKVRDSLDSVCRDRRQARRFFTLSLISLLISPFQSLVFFSIRGKYENPC